MPHNPLPPLAGQWGHGPEPMRAFCSCGLCMSFTAPILPRDCTGGWATPVTSCSPRHLPHWTQSRKVNGQRGNTSSLAKGPKALLQDSMVPGFSSSLLWNHQQQKGRSQRGPFLQHTAQPQGMWPLDVGAQHVWSSMPCCVEMEIGNLQGAPHVWDQARRRMTQLPTSSLQGESGLLLQKNPTPCTPHDQGRCHKQGKTQRCPGDLHGTHPIWAVGPLPSVWLLAQLSQVNERRHWVGRSRLISALGPQATHSPFLYFIQGSPHSTRAPARPGLL